MIKIPECIVKDVICTKSRYASSKLFIEQLVLKCDEVLLRSAVFNFFTYYYIVIRLFYFILPTTPQAFSFKTYRV